MFYPVPSIASTSINEVNGRRVAISPDKRSYNRLIDMMLSSAGLTQAEAARRLGITIQSLHQYKRAKRINPSLAWFARLAELCGAYVYVDLAGPTMLAEVDRVEQPAKRLLEPLGEAESGLVGPDPSLGADRLS